MELSEVERCVEVSPRPAEYRGAYDHVVRRHCNAVNPYGRIARGSVPANACTSVPVSKGASADGSVMTAHTCDGWYDARTFVVPGQTHPEGAMFTCYKGLLHSDRAEPIKIGEIPEAPVTYTYFYAGDPYMNEHGVIMGETTIGNRRELSTDEGLLYIETLQILGLQRAKTAREAIQIMGSLAEEYGYVDGGECLTVGDQNEIWHFEIMPPGAFQKGAIWAAVRIPEGHVGVSANRSRIGKIDLSDPENYMASSNVFDVAIENGWWDPESGEPFLFYEAYAPNNSMNMRRREWRVLSLVAPSLRLDANASRFPFTVKAEYPITVQDMMRIYRDTYEGTPYDKANVNDWYVPDGRGGFYKSPFATPDVSSEFAKLVDAPNERNISIPGCSYFTILQSRSWLPPQVGTLAWFGLNQTDTSVYVPIYAGVTKLPDSYAINDRTKFGSTTSRRWAFDLVDNLVNRRYLGCHRTSPPCATPSSEQFALQPHRGDCVELSLKLIAVKFLTNYAIAAATWRWIPTGSWLRC